MLKMRSSVFAIAIPTRPILFTEVNGDVAASAMRTTVTINGMNQVCLDIGTFLLLTCRFLSGDHLTPFLLEK